MTPLELFITTGEIIISNDPVSGFKRKAILSRGFSWLPTFKQIILDYEIQYYETSELRYPNYFKKLIADNDTLIDGTNLPEYQYFMNLVSVQNNIFEVIYNITMLRDSQGKFNF